jgi:hypothetical protein
MRKALFIFFVILNSWTFAHDYFFAFAEVEYDEMNGRIEATVTMTTHDFERYLQKNQIIKQELASCLGDSLKMQSIEKELNKHFYFDLSPLSENSIMDGDESFHFKLDGFETQLTGIVQFYLSTNINRPLESFEVVFDVLMDDHVEQQNKLTVINRGKKQTYVFLPTKRSQIIDLY